MQSKSIFSPGLTFPLWRHHPIRAGTFFIRKAHESKAIIAFYAEVVYQHDHFRSEFAPKHALTHLPPTDDSGRGTVIGAYAMVEFKDGHCD
jgi:hypothetical protein